MPRRHPTVTPEMPHGRIRIGGGYFGTRFCIIMKFNLGGLRSEKHPAYAIYDWLWRYPTARLSMLPQSTSVAKADEGR